MGWQCYGNAMAAGRRRCTGLLSGAPAPSPKKPAGGCAGLPSWPGPPPPAMQRGSWQTTSDWGASPGGMAFSQAASSQ